MNGANVLDAAELVAHLDQTVTVAVADEGRDAVSEQVGRGRGWRPLPISWEMASHLTRIAAMRAHWLGMELSEGPPYCWSAGHEVFYTWPLRPRGSQLPYVVTWASWLPKWSEEFSREMQTALWL
jgi:hypothetical protein